MLLVDADAIALFRRVCIFHNSKFENEICCFSRYSRNKALAKIQHTKVQLWCTYQIAICYQEIIFIWRPTGELMQYRYVSLVFSLDERDEKRWTELKQNKEKKMNIESQARTSNHVTLYSIVYGSRIHECRCCNNNDGAKRPYERSLYPSIIMLQFRFALYCEDMYIVHSLGVKLLFILFSSLSSFSWA